MHTINGFIKSFRNLLFFSFSEVMGGGEANEKKQYTNNEKKELSDLQKNIEGKQSTIEFQGKTGKILGKGIERNIPKIEDKEDIDEITAFQERVDMLNRDNDLLSRSAYLDGLELNKDFLGKSFDESNSYFKEDFINTLESGEVSDFAKELVENKDLSNITAGEFYSLKQEGYDLSELFLVNPNDKENFVSKEHMEEGDSFIVNFGGNKSLNSYIGAGDLLDIENVSRVSINGVEGERKFNPRPGYYSAEGKYLAVFDNYEIKVLEKRELSQDELGQSENAFNSRFDEIRGQELSSIFRSDLNSNKDLNSIELSGLSKKDLQYLQGYLEKYIPKNGLDNLDFDIENQTVSTKDGKSLGEFISESLPQGVGYEKYKDIVDKVTEKYPGISSENLSRLINHENRAWDPTAGAPGSSAYGLGQMIDSTWNNYGKGLDRNNPVDQLEATCKYLDAIMNRKNCSVELAMAYYNTGEGILKVSDSKAKEYARLNPAISRKIDSGEPITAKTYLTGAIAYYSDINYNKAKKYL